MTKLKFDRERFLRGEMPTRTRGGRKLLHVHNSGLNCEHPIVAWIEGNDYPLAFRADGRICLDHIVDIDLVHEPRMRKVRVAVFMVEGHVYSYTDTGDHRFDAYIATMSKEGKLIKVLEVEVPE